MHRNDFWPSKDILNRNTVYLKFNALARMSDGKPILFLIFERTVISKTVIL